MSNNTKILPRKKSTKVDIKSYQLKVNLSGVAFVTPVLHSKENREIETFEVIEAKIKRLELRANRIQRLFDSNKISSTWYDQLVKENANKYEVLLKDRERLERKKYDRKNKISIEGTEIKSKQRQKIKNAILYRYYSTRGNSGGRMKFFTFTVQASFYFQKQKEYENGFSKIPADTFFNKQFSKLLENLQKRKNDNLENYIWIAEKTKKGVIHYHCIFEGYYLDVQKLSTYWSNLCGFTDKINSVQIGFDKKDKNGNRIENLKNVNGDELSAYLTKYVSQGGCKIFGRAYGMSKKYTEFSKQGEVKIQQSNLEIISQATETEKAKARLIFTVPEKINYETGELIPAEKKVIQVNLLYEKTIDVSGNEIPYYIISIERKKMFFNFYNKLYSNYCTCEQRIKNSRKDYKKPENSPVFATIC